jgi:hypothetical protein
MTNGTNIPDNTNHSVNNSELDLPLWSVVSFSGVESTGLTYQEARKLLDKLESNKVAGLCIITDMAADRLRS